MLALSHQRLVGTPLSISDTCDQRAGIAPLKKRRQGFRKVCKAVADVLAVGE
jgi:hypothetical protein